MPGRLTVTHVLDAADAFEALRAARDASLSSRVLLRFAAADTAADDDSRG